MSETTGRHFYKCDGCECKCQLNSFDSEYPVVNCVRKFADPNFEPNWEVV